MAKKRIDLSEVGTADMVNSSKKENKRSKVKVGATVTARVATEIKYALEDLALNEDISLSKYIERLLKAHVTSS